MPPLTMQQIQLFRNNGFLCLPECLPEETVEALKNAIRDDIDNEVEPIVRNKDGRAIRISASMDRDSIFRDAATHTTMTVGYHSVDDLMDIPNPKRLLVRVFSLFSRLFSS